MKIAPLVCQILCTALILAEGIDISPSLSNKDLKEDERTHVARRETAAIRTGAIRKSGLGPRCYTYYKKWDDWSGINFRGHSRIRIQKNCSKQLLALPMFRNKTIRDDIESSGLSVECYWFYGTLDQRAGLRHSLDRSWNGLNKACEGEILDLPFFSGRKEKSVMHSSELSPGCFWYFRMGSLQTALGQWIVTWSGIRDACRLEVLALPIFRGRKQQSAIRKSGVSPKCLWYLTIGSSESELAAWIVTWSEFDRACHRELLALPMFRSKTRQDDIIEGGLGVKCSWFYGTLDQWKGSSWDALRDACRRKVFSNTMFRGEEKRVAIRNSRMSAECYWFFKFESLQSSLGQWIRSWDGLKKFCTRKLLALPMFRGEDVQTAVRNRGVSLKCFWYFMSESSQSVLAKWISSWDSLKDACTQELLALPMFRGDNVQTNVRHIGVNPKCFWYFKIESSQSGLGKWMSSWAGVNDTCTRELLALPMFRSSFVKTAVRRSGVSPKCFWYFRFESSQSVLGERMSSWVELKDKCTGEFLHLPMFRGENVRTAMRNIGVSPKCFLYFSTKKSNLAKWISSWDGLKDACMGELFAQPMFGGRDVQTSITNREASRNCFWYFRFESSQSDLSKQMSLCDEIRDACTEELLALPMFREEDARAAVNNSEVSTKCLKYITCGSSQSGVGKLVSRLKDACTRDLLSLPMFRGEIAQAAINESGLSPKCAWYFKIKSSQSSWNNSISTWEWLRDACTRELLALPMFQGINLQMAAREGGLSPKCYWYLKMDSSLTYLGQWMISWDWLRDACDQELLVIPLIEAKHVENELRNSGISLRCYWYFIIVSLKSLHLNPWVSSWGELKERCRRQVITLSMFRGDEKQAALHNSGYTPMCYWFNKIRHNLSNVAWVLDLLCSIEGINRLAKEKKAVRKDEERYFRRFNESMGNRLKQYLSYISSPQDKR